MKPANQQQPLPQPSLALKRLAVSPTVALALALVILLGLNLLAGLLLTTASQESQVLLSHLEALRRNRRNVEQLETDLLSSSGKISQILSTLPQESDIPDFLQFVTDTGQSFAATAALNFTSNQPSLTRDKLAIIPFTLQVSLNSTDLDKFLTALHQGKYQLRFEHLETEIISPPTSKIQARLSGKLYVSDQFIPGAMP